MKRAISIILLIIMMYFIYQYSVIGIKKNHEIKYDFEKEDKVFKIKENYNKTKNYDQYIIEINYNNYEFSFDVENIFNKRTKILSDLKYYENDGMMCIYPIFSNNITTEIVCSKDNNKYSYTSAVNINSNISEFLKTLKLEKNIDISWGVEDEPFEKNNLKIYKNSFADNEKIIIWNYNGIRIVSKNLYNEVKTLEKDLYENKLGSLVGKFYVIPDYENAYQFKTFSIVNIVDCSIREMQLDDLISSDSYSNGIVNKKIYIYDKDNIKQYEIDPINKDYKVIGDKEKNGQFYNGQWSAINIYDFKNSEIKFVENYASIEQFKNYSISKVYTSNTSFYLLTNDGSMYRLNKDALDDPILLFKEQNIKELKIVKDNIYYVLGDTLYKYSKETGKKKIITYNEFSYNHENMFDIYISE
ncbi:MAG: hypothetical protein PHQ64_04240 [Bacilli bacterium]|nr:hypothetical protein [Bacilli bacterium]